MVRLYAVSPVTTAGPVVTPGAAQARVYAVAPVASAPVAASARARVYTVASVALAPASVTGRRLFWVRPDGVRVPARAFWVRADGSRLYFDTVGAAAPPALDYSDQAAVYASWKSAWDADDEEVLLDWFLEHTGPRIPLSGTHPGGTIATQAQADALAGKTVTGDVMFDAVGLQVRDAYFLGRLVDYDWNTQTDVQHCTIDGNDQTFTSGHHSVKGTVTFRHNRIRRAQDAFKTNSLTSVPTFEYNLIHEPSQQIGSLTGNDTHQDAIQVTGGDFTGRRSYLDYENNYVGGQGIIVKADTTPITHFELTETFIRAGGNNLTFEATVNGYAQAVILGSGVTRNRFAPAINMINVVSIYADPPSGYFLPQSFVDNVNGQSFFVAGSVSTLNYVNGIDRNDLLAAAAQPTTATGVVWSHDSGEALPGDWTSVVDPQNYLALSTGIGGEAAIVMTATGVIAEASLVKSGLPVQGAWRYDVWMEVDSTFALSEVWRDFRFLTISNGTGEIIRVMATGGSPGQFRVDRTSPSYLRIANNVSSFPREAKVKISVTGSGHGTTSGTLAVLVNDVQIAAETGINFTSVAAPTTVKWGPHGDPDGTSMTGVLRVYDGQMTITS